MLFCALLPSWPKKSQNLKTVYFISGLGADRRAFQFLDLTFCNPVFIDWLRPEEGESLSSYAFWMKGQIPDEEPEIVGLSFGGMVAIEIAKQFPVKKLILLSSAKTEKEIPFYLRYMRHFPLHKAFSPSLLRSANQLAYRLMGIHQREDKVIFSRMLKDADDYFLTRAIDQIIHWKNTREVPNTFHIHGTADIMLPCRYVKANHVVKGGKHLMLMTRGITVSDLLRQIIG